MNQSERTAYLLSEIHTAKQTLEQGLQDDEKRYPCIAGTLTSMLAGMAGLGKFTTHTSCFSPEITQAIQKLLKTIDQS